MKFAHCLPLLLSLLLLAIINQLEGTAEAGPHGPKIDTSSPVVQFDQVVDWNDTDPIPADIKLQFPKWIDEWVAPPEVRKWFPYYLAGYDDEGCPLYVIEYGKWNFAEALTKAKDGPDKMKDIFMKYFEQGVYRILRDGLANDAQGVGAIFDWDQFDFGNYADPTAIELGMKQFSMLDRLYNVLNYALVINTNFAAENFLRIVKPFIGNILEKCEIFGTQKTKWMPHLVRKISKSQLPPWYGGEETWQPVLLGGLPLNSTKILPKRRAM